MQVEQAQAGAGLAEPACPNLHPRLPYPKLHLPALQGSARTCPCYSAGTDPSHPTGQAGVLLGIGEKVSPRGVLQAAPDECWRQWRPGGPAALALIRIGL